MKARGKGSRSLWGLDFGHSLSTKIMEGERRTPKALLAILEGVDKNFQQSLIHHHP